MEKIIVVCEPQFNTKCKSFFSKFISNYSYFDDIRLTFSDDFDYAQYEADILHLHSAYASHVFLTDTRFWPGHQDEPIRLLLRESFFQEDFRRQASMMLHEIGHLMTNPRLAQIQKYKFAKSPKPLTLPTSDPRVLELLDRHNTALYYIFFLLKAPLEINGEMWLFENQPEISRGRIERLANDLADSLEDLDSSEVRENFLYHLPRYVFMATILGGIARHMEMEDKEDFTSKADEAWSRILEVAQKRRLASLSLITLRGELYEAIDYGDEDVHWLTSIYEEMVHNFARTSIENFPEEFREKLLEEFSDKK